MPIKLTEARPLGGQRQHFNHYLCALNGSSIDDSQHPPEEHPPERSWVVRRLAVDGDHVRHSGGVSPA